ncbi:MAG: YCF48-related protein [Ignavibacteria bacterium]|nr:YCF48-related protein [Ignavibacteria bacterium]
MSSRSGKLIVLYLNFFISSLAFTQWFPQTSGINHAIKSVYFQNTETGFASSYNVILKTTNGGNSWQMFPIEGSLNCITFINNLTGFSCGDSGKIYRTTNGGANWVNILSNTTSDLTSLKFADQNIGIVCGKNKTILKTTNGGINWFNVANLVWQIDIYEIKIIDTDNYYLSAGDSFILKTTNGGTNWLIYTHGEPNPLFTIDFINPNTGFATGCCGMFMKTTNSGLNWTTGFYLSLGFSFYSMKFINNQTGYLAGDNGMIYRTTNGGQSWDSTTTPTNETLYSVCMVNENTGWSAGSGGVILKTTNGGGIGFPIGIQEYSDEHPSELKLYQNYPNPFNSNTNISFSVKVKNLVTLDLFNLKGQKIQTLYSAITEAGNYSINLNSSALASGLYFCRIRSGKEQRTIKIILLK